MTRIPDSLYRPIPTDPEKQVEPALDRLAHHFFGFPGEVVITLRDNKWVIEHRRD